MDIWTVAIRNNRNVHAILTKRIADILYFNDREEYWITFE